MKCSGAREYAQARPTFHQIFTDLKLWINRARPVAGRRRADRRRRAASTAARTADPEKGQLPAGARAPPDLHLVRGRFTPANTSASSATTRRMGRGGFSNWRRNVGGN